MFRNVPQVEYNEVTFEKLIEAFTSVLDGTNEFELKDNTGMSEDQCNDIMEIYRKLMKNYQN